MSGPGDKASLSRRRRRRYSLQRLTYFTRSPPRRRGSAVHAARRRGGAVRAVGTGVGFSSGWRHRCQRPGPQMKHLFPTGEVNSVFSSRLSMIGAKSLTHAAKWFLRGAQWWEQGQRKEFTHAAKMVPVKHTIFRGLWSRRVVRVKRNHSCSVCELSLLPQQGHVREAL